MSSAMHRFFIRWNRGRTRPGFKPQCPVTLSKWPSGSGYSCSTANKMAASKQQAWMETVRWWSRQNYAFSTEGRCRKTHTCVEKDYHQLCIRNIQLKEKKNRPYKKEYTANKMQELRQELKSVRKKYKLPKPEERYPIAELRDIIKTS